MDILEKLNSNLEPLEGDLFIDGFVEAVRGPGNQSPPQSAQKTVALAFSEHGAGAETVDVDPDVTSFGDRGGHEEPDEKSGSEISETGRLRVEVEEFMNRVTPEAAAEDEIKEFLEDRSGFDPTEYE